MNVIYLIAALQLTVRIKNNNNVNDLYIGSRANQIKYKNCNHYKSFCNPALNIYTGLSKYIYGNQNIKIKNIILRELSEAATFHIALVRKCVFVYN